MVALLGEVVSSNIPIGRRLLMGQVWRMYRWVEWVHVWVYALMNTPKPPYSFVVVQLFKSSDNETQLKCSTLDYNDFA